MTSPKSRRSTFRLRLLIAASLFAVLPVVVLGTVSYLIADYNIRQEVGKANRATMKQIQEHIDEKLVNINKMMLQQAMNPMLREFLLNETPYLDFEKYPEIVEMLNTLKNVNGDVLSADLYFVNNDYLIRSSGQLPASEEVVSLVKERKLLRQKKPYYLFDWTSLEGNHYVTMIRSVPVFSDKPRGYLIVNIEDKTFFRLFSSLEAGQTGEMMIFTSSGNVLSDKKKAFPFSRKLLQQINSMQGNSDIYTEEIGGTKTVVNALNSPQNGWKYVLFVPLRELTQHFDWIKQITIGLSALLIVTGLFGAFLLSKKFSRTLQSLIDFMKRKNVLSPQSMQRLDEFGVIHNYMESLQMRNESLIEEIEQSKPILQMLFLQRLLAGTLPQDEIREKLAYYGFPARWPFYTVLCAEIDNLRGQTERDAHLFVYAAMNIVQEIFNHGEDMMVMNMPANRIAIVVNHISAPSGQTQSHIFRQAEEILIAVQRLLNISVSIGVGRCYEGAEQIRHSFREAMEALHHRLVVGSDNVLFIDQINPNLIDFSLPIEIEQQILTHMKLGNLEQVRANVDEFAEIARVRCKSYSHLQSCFIQLIASTVRVFHESDPDGAPNAFSYNLFHKLSEFRTLQQIKNWLKQEIYPEIVKRVLERRKQHHFDMIDRVLYYIHEHFSEDLSQPEMAEMLSMPPSHFSQMFKDQVGMTFSDYLIAYRMEKAKECLINTDMKIGDIASWLRYNNAQNFIRIFKRTSGVTPGDYRKQHAGMNRNATGEPLAANGEVEPLRGHEDHDAAVV